MAEKILLEIVTPEKKVLSEVNMGAPIYSTGVVANGTMFVATQTHLFAIAAEPRMAGMSVGYAVIMGINTAKPIPENKLPTKKISCKPSRLGRAKIYLKP